MRRLAAAVVTTLAASLSRGARRLPRRRASTSARAAAPRAAAMTPGLDAFAARADASWPRCLVEDPEASRHAPNQESRQVRSGHWVPVAPTPLARPALALVSEELAADLGLTEKDWTDDRFARYFGGDSDALDLGATWATPYALAIMGEPQTRNCPFGNGNGYGDGRAVSVGEVVTDARYELQLKGGGKTPFCRGADGRAVLRSSIREFLASEAMHFLGVPTTRALSLVVSASETTRRPWYSRRDDGQAEADEEISEDDPRLAQFPLAMRRQLIRQLMAQRGGGQDPDVMIQEPCAITTRVAASFARVGHLDLFARRAARGGAAEQREHALLVQHAIAREYPELLPGDGDATRRAPLATPELRTAALAFAEAARDRLAALAAGWLRVGFCQGNFNADNCLVAGRTMDYGPFGFVDRYDPGFAKWVGSGDHFAFANQPGAALANYGTLIKALAPLFDDTAPLQEIADSAHDHFAAAVDACYAAKLGFGDGEAASGTPRTLWRRLEPLLRGLDYTIFFRQLAAAAEARPEDAYGLVVEPAAYGDVPAEKRDGLDAWLREWRAAVGGGGGVAARLRAANPKFILREWMLVDAYDAAGRGDFGPARELHALVKRPYDEQDELAPKYYRRAPAGALNRAGTAWMT